MEKIYRHVGLEFRISQAPKPAADGIPYFSSGEWGWIKSQNLDHSMFRVLVLARVDDMRSPVIPEEVGRQAVILAKQYGPAICAQLRAAGAGRAEGQHGKA